MVKEGWVTDEILSREDNINAAVADVDVCKNFRLFDFILNYCTAKNRKYKSATQRKLIVALQLSTKILR